jgi:hypothetical protein
LLTGLYAHHHGVIENKAKPFQPQMTLATQLDAAGYYTFLVGKYLNLYGLCCAPAVPPGWDRWAAFGDPAYYDYDLWIDGGATPEHHGSAPADYSTDVLAEKAASLIAAAPRRKPIFAWIAAFGPHAPSTPAPRDVGAPCGLGRWDPPNWNEADVSDKPAYVRAQPLSKGLPPTATVACRPLLAVDDLVARVRDALAAKGRLANTLFVYMGDNGMNSGEHRLTGKAAPYETLVPFYVSWPARLGATPRTISERVENVDFAPTICDLAGCSLGPYPTGQTTPDGKSFAGLLVGNEQTLGRDAVLEELPATASGVPLWFSVTTTPLSPLGLWHYVEYGTGESELYDVSNGPCWKWHTGARGDPCELENRVSDPSLASLVAQLHTRLQQLRG